MVASAYLTCFDVGAWIAFCIFLRPWLYMLIEVLPAVIDADICDTLSWGTIWQHFQGVHQVRKR
eukprot:655309-Amphidinium_carterae.3